MQILLNWLVTCPTADSHRNATWVWRVLGQWAWGAKREGGSRRSLRPSRQGAKVYKRRRGFKCSLVDFSAGRYSWFNVYFRFTEDRRSTRERTEVWRRQVDISLFDFMLKYIGKFTESLKSCHSLEVFAKIQFHKKGNGSECQWMLLYNLIDHPFE